MGSERGFIFKLNKGSALKWENKVGPSEFYGNSFAGVRQHCKNIYIFHLC